uniref:ATP synthase subunit a n=1 Tax=Aphrodita australis TaxID=2715517 RepID=A0A6G7IY61_9ANNE|nr:ATP synthase F0 subunit 6 [Aphrodita australis]QII43118.1 ATP synthase F0 subunit 6 [Aphrodita australis]
MMSDIFSTFDPATSTLFHSLSPFMFWAMTILSLSMLHSSFWISSSRWSQSISYPMNIMLSQTNRTTASKIKGFPSILIPLFLYLIISNLLGLVPYMFSNTSHLIFTMSFGVPLWLSLIISSATYSPKMFSAHFLPSGAPDWLNPFLVLIETMSTLFRPLTLSFRLAANMSAGHIVLGLAGIYASTSLFTSTLNSSLLLTAQLMYIIFEIGICLIQAYIFCLLISLYSDDHPTY